MKHINGLGVVLATAALSLVLGGGAGAQAPATAPADDCTASIAFKDCPEGNLDPTGKKEISLAWHATAKGKDCGVCTISATAVATNEEGSAAEVITLSNFKEDPELPHIMKGKADGGNIKIQEAAACHIISLASAANKQQGGPGFDRLCITITIVCTKGRQVTAHDADVCCLICPPK